MPVTSVRSKGSSGSLVFENLSGTELMTISSTGVNIPTFTIDSLILDAGATVDLNGIADAFILDADADTTISAPTDDQIDIEIAGADDFTFTANSFNVLTGSGIDLADSCAITLGTGDDVTLTFDGTNLVLATAVADTGALALGADDAGVDVIFYGDTASENMTWDQSADDLILTAAVRIVGQGSTVSTLKPIAAQQALSGPGAVNITTYYTAVTTTGADALTLVDGAQVGQEKKIQMIVDGGDGTLTPSNLSGGTTITFADVGDTAELVWDGTNWVAVALYNIVDGATAPVLA